MIGDDWSDEAYAEGLVAGKNGASEKDSPYIVPGKETEMTSWRHGLIAGRRRLDYEAFEAVTDTGVQGREPETPTEGVEEGRQEDPEGVQEAQEAEPEPPEEEDPDPDW